MNITFKSAKFAAIVNNDRKLLKELGKLRADKVRLRLNQLDAADTLEVLRHTAGHYHDLTGDRKGQWSCDLDQPYRLIFEPHENPIPTNDAGQYIWSEIRGVRIIEIVDYH